MTLNFPAVPDLQLDNAPLTDVLCQVRFPRVLRIRAEEPSAFQDLIRREFPLFEVEHSMILNLPPTGNTGVPVAEPTGKVYRFRTTDKHTMISLATDFCAVSTTAYTHWDDFLERLAFAQRALETVYAPAYVSRLGLRYINQLTPANTGRTTAQALAELLRPELTASTRSTAWGPPTELLCRFVVPDEQGKLSIAVEWNAEQAPLLVRLDFDYFEAGELDLASVPARLVRYHDRIYQAFLWCLRDDLVDVFQPRVKGTS